MKLFLLFGALVSVSCYAAETPGPDYSKYQEPPMVKLDETTFVAHVPTSITLTNPRYNEGVMVLVDGVVVFYVRDKINKIEFGKKESKCTIL